MGIAVSGPYELAFVQSACGQPDADAVVHQNLQPVGFSVSKQLGMVRMSGTEYRNHARKRSVGAGAHIQRCRGQPGRINSDHVWFI